MDIDPKIGDIVRCTECDKEFVLQQDSACFDDEDCRCPDCVDEWEEQVEEEILSAHTPQKSK